MEGYHPKRRRDKYNPYRIYIKDDHFYVAFIDGKGMHHELEIDKSLYDAFNAFELEDLSYLNVWDRHIEQQELRESSVNQRAIHKSDNIEDIVMKKFQLENLYNALKEIPATQRRRLEFYFFKDMTYDQIAQVEGCSKTAVKHAVDRALNILKKYLE